MWKFNIYGDRLLMKKNKSKNSLYKRIFYYAIFIYVLYVLIGQQRTLNTYKKNQEYYSKQLNEQVAYREKLTNTKNNINSKEYIEQIAREKLDMYLPNERIYIDKGN